MPVLKKKDTTAATAKTASETPDFHQHLRALIRSATRIVMEEVMREELEQVGENAARNAKAIVTGPTRVIWQGQPVGLKISPSQEIVRESSTRKRLSATVAMSQRLRKDSPKWMSRGTSTHKVGEVAQTLMGTAPSASTISRLNQSLTQQFEAWRERSLQTHWRIMYLDGVHFKIRHGDQCDTSIILTALGVDLEGNKDVLALRACAEEDKEGWVSRLARYAHARSHGTRSDRDGWT